MTRVRIVAAVTVGLSLALVAGIYFYTPDPDRIDAAVRNIGFYPITPPSNLRGPGSIYHVSSDGAYLSMLCQAEEDQIKQAMRSSPTTKQVSTELKKAKASISVELLRRVTSSTDVDLLESIKLELDDVEVAEISLEDLATIASDLMERQSCGRQVESYLKAGHYVCQGQQVLKATTTYRSDYNNAGSTKGGVFRTQSAPDVTQTVSVIQAHVDAEARVEGSKITSGKGLYYGMKLAPLCMSLPDERGKRPPLTRWHRFLNNIGVV